uniref:Uncharacterized protein n=1 Tax=Sphenodon punctatus TaxID=8508 RepID=A0A8D0GA28_SPHPU
MASLYQRLSGKINTSRSFPLPPEASHLLGAQGAEEDRAAGKTSRPLQQDNNRPRFQYQPRSDCEEEDVSGGSPLACLARGWLSFKLLSQEIVFPLQNFKLISLIVQSEGQKINKVW